MVERRGRPNRTITFGRLGVDSDSGWQPGDQVGLTSSSPSHQGPRTHLFPMLSSSSATLKLQLLSPFSISSFIPTLQCKYMDISAKKSK